MADKPVLKVEKMQPTGKPRWEAPNPEHGVTGFAKNVPLPKPKPSKP